MLNIIIALLIHKDILDKEEGKALVEKLRTSTLPADFNSSMKLVQKIFIAIEKER